MEEFRKSLGRKIIFCIVYAVLMMAVHTALLIVKLSGSDFEFGFVGGFCFVGVVSAVMQAVQARGALKDGEKLKKMYIESTDERTRLIREKTLSSSFRAVLYGAVPAMMVSAFLSSTVLYTLICVIGFMIFSQIIFEAYYNKKF